MEGKIKVRFYGKRIPIELLRESAGEIRDGNRIINPKIDTIHLTTLLNSLGEVGERDIWLSENLFTNPSINPGLTVWHELAHRFWRSALEYSYKENVYDMTQKVIRASLKKYYPAESALEGISINSRTGWWNYCNPPKAIPSEKFRKNSLIFVLSGDSYTPPIFSERIQNSAEEFFAEISGFIGYYSREFQNKLENLPSNEEKELGIEAVRLILSPYLQNPNCPKRFKHLKNLR